MQEQVTYVSLESDESLHDGYEAALLEVEREFGKRHPMYIGGREVAARREFEARSPIDPDILLGTFPSGEEEHAREAIAAANEAFPAWSRRGWRERAGIVGRTADAIEARRFPLAALLTYEAGKTRYEAVAEVGETVAMLRYYCGVYEQNGGYIVPLHSPAPGEECRSVMRPYGAWAVISPFNFPLALAAGMIAGALLTGNTVVFKPTSKTPLAGVTLYGLFVEGGVPPGAINLVTGPGGPFGEVVVADPGVAGIAFTGSRAVGMRLERESAAIQPYHRPLVAELGSKNPVIVTASADIEKAAEGVTRAAYGFAGQKCSAASRVYVHSSVAERFLQALRARVERMEVGDPRRREVAYGPLIDDDARQTFRRAVEEAVRDGGRLVAGGEALDDGLSVRPTVIAGLRHDHRLFSEELFVPVLLGGTFETHDEANHHPNATEYGLTAGIFAEDQEEIGRFFDRIRFGVVYANRRGGATTGAWPGAQPFGGWKASGTTGRGAGGPYYLLSFVREQAETRVTEPADGR